MSTFIGQLIGFAVVAWLIWKFVVPVLKKAVATRQETVGQQIIDSEAAAASAKDAEIAHEKAEIGRASCRERV